MDCICWIIWSVGEPAAEALLSELVGAFCRLAGAAELLVGDAGGAACEASLEATTGSEGGFSESGALATSEPVRGIFRMAAFSATLSVTLSAGPAISAPVDLAR